MSQHHLFLSFFYTLIYALLTSITSVSSQGMKAFISLQTLNDYKNYIIPLARQAALSTKLQDFKQSYGTGVFETHLIVHDFEILELNFSSRNTDLAIQNQSLNLSATKLGVLLEAKLSIKSSFYTGSMNLLASATNGTFFSLMNLSRTEEGKLHLNLQSFNVSITDFVLNATGGDHVVKWINQGWKVARSRLKKYLSPNIALTLAAAVQGISNSILHSQPTEILIPFVDFSINYKIPIQPVFEEEGITAAIEGTFRSKNSMMPKRKPPRRSTAQDRDLIDEPASQPDPAQLPFSLHPNVLPPVPLPDREYELNDSHSIRNQTVHLFVSEYTLNTLLQALYEQEYLKLLNVSALIPPNTIKLDTTFLSLLFPELPNDHGYNKDVLLNCYAEGPAPFGYITPRNITANMSGTCEFFVEKEAGTRDYVLKLDLTVNATAEAYLNNKDLMFRILDFDVDNFVVRHKSGKVQEGELKNVFLLVLRIFMPQLQGFLDWVRVPLPLFFDAKLTHPDLILHDHYVSALLTPTWKESVMWLERLEEKEDADRRARREQVLKGEVEEREMKNNKEAAGKTAESLALNYFIWITSLTASFIFSSYL